MVESIPDLENGGNGGNGGNGSATTSSNVSKD